MNSNGLAQLACEKGLYVLPAADKSPKDGSVTLRE
jgi:hypothetical protein